MAVKFRPVLSIAGSDNCGGAGLQADLKTFMAIGCYGLSAVTAVTAQRPQRFGMYQAMTSKVVYEQIRYAVELARPLAVKTGMLASAENISAVARARKKFGLAHLVIDPVLRSSSGKSLRSGGFVGALKKELLAGAYAVTPNRMEAEILAGQKIESYEDVSRAAKIILGLGVENVIIKGGHFGFDPLESVDILYTGQREYRFVQKRLAKADFHGTGCVFSAALCAYTALGCDIRLAVKKAKGFLGRAMSSRLQDGPPGILNFTGR